MEWSEHDSLLYYCGCIYVPDTSDLRRRIVSLCHDTKVAGHPGCFETLELISWSYWWPNMSRYVGLHISHCDLCLCTKIQCRLPSGELQPLPILEAPRSKQKGLASGYHPVPLQTTMPHFRNGQRPTRMWINSPRDPGVTRRQEGCTSLISKPGI